jgi:hypothetical protein
MNFSELPISEVITGVLAAAIAWITGGKYAAKSTKIDNTAKLIEIWEKSQPQLPKRTGRNA